MPGDTPQRNVLYPVVVAAIAFLLSTAYMAINVVWNYHGNLTGLFYTGWKVPLPPELEAELTWRVKDEKGYDAQYYHVITHDPLFRQFRGYVDNPPLRWRRIGIPGFAALLNTFTHADVHWTYILLQLAFLVLGSYWLSLYSVYCGMPAWIGLSFLTIPAVLVSIDRMTIDLTLAALVVGFVWFGAIRPKWHIYCILAFAPLVRETGIVLILAWCVSNSIRLHWKRVWIGAACALPAFVWWMYVQIHSATDHTPWLARYPFSGLVEQTFTAHNAPHPTAWLRAASVTEFVALAGIWLAFGFGIFLLYRKRFGLEEITAAAFIAFASALGKADIWDTAYAVGRTMSPLLGLLLMVGIRDRCFIYAAPILLVLPRIALQFQAQITAAFRAAAG